jgi:hypothetical protein
MNKLRLQLEDLTVASFDTCPAEPKRGTVVGQQCTCVTACTCPGCPTCAGYNTCDASCGGTCDNAWSCQESCGGTCFNSRCIDSCLCQ